MEHDILERIVDGREKPRHLPFSLLKNITENFSEDRVIGHGRFATVYEGVLPNGSVAVKRILKRHVMNEKLFFREVDILLTINNHQNVVRFLGFCSSIEYTATKIEGSGQYIYAELRESLLCFEYISNGSLQKHITDELRGLEWNTRYQIIRGICQGLHHLHEQNIYHMDLKPANILLDNYMTPKIIDFGLSRGYCAPEYLRIGEMSLKSDMFSLGTIITELVTGEKGIPDNNQKNNVLRRWRHRWRKSGKETPLVYQQVAKCMEIGLFCQEIDPSKRPFIWDVIHDIREMDSFNGTISNAEYTFGTISSYSNDQMLGIEPLELHFPFELNKHILSSFELSNDMSAYIGFYIRNTSSLKFFIEPNRGILPPESKCSVEIILRAQEKAPQYMQQAYAFMLQSTEVKYGLEPEDITASMFKEKLHNVVDEVILDVALDAQLQNELVDFHQLEYPFPSEPNNLTPIVLRLDVLKAITNDFSPELELGRGGYGVVYKGTFPRGEVIAVKKLLGMHLVKDDQFQDEVSQLMGITHINVVRTLGYCAETSSELMPQPTGRPIWADEPKRLICFEYVPNKSLDKYISDESLGLEWNLRYEIIKGICKGLHFLHEKCRIVHRDLKPENILMDAGMVPKIADFGLSKIFGDKQTRLIIPDKSRAGSFGYMAPEYIVLGTVSFRTDIFSLGVIIIQIVTGHMEYPRSIAYLKLFNEDHCPQSVETSFQDYIKSVLGHWKKKFASTPKYDEAVEKYTKQVKQCIDIALNCVDADVTNRPTAKDIIQVLIGLDQDDLAPPPVLYSRAGHQNYEEAKEGSSELRSVTTDGTAEASLRTSSSKVSPFRHRFPMDPDQATKLCKIVTDAIHEYYAGGFENYPHEKLYRIGYTIVIHKRSENLYSAVETVICSEVEGISRALDDTALDGVLFLEELLAKWRLHKEAASYTRNIVMYMDRTFVPTTKRTPIYDMALRVWLNNLVRSGNVLRKLIAEVRREREGGETAADLSGVAEMLKELDDELYHQVMGVPAVTE